MTIVLRYRDLTVPEGVTIERHREIIEREDIVMWGWMMRQSETVPISHLTKVAENPEHAEFLIYDSGSGEIRKAVLKTLSVFPGGIRIPATPIPSATPTYMAEALCPVWFHFSAIDDHKTDIESLIILEYPTLSSPKQVDAEKLNKTIALGHSEHRRYALGSFKITGAEGND